MRTSTKGRAAVAVAAVPEVPEVAAVWMAAAGAQAVAASLRERLRVRGSPWRSSGSASSSLGDETLEGIDESHGCTHLGGESDGDTVSCGDRCRYRTNAGESGTR